MPILKLQITKNFSKVFEITQELIIGRGSQSDILILCDSISRRHARVYLEGSSVILEDLGSANGCVVNNKKVSLHVLQDQDVIQIGKKQLIFSTQGATKGDAKELVRRLRAKDPQTKAETIEKILKHFRPGDKSTAKEIIEILAKIKQMIIYVAQAMNMSRAGQEIPDVTLEDCQDAFDLLKETGMGITGSKEVPLGASRSPVSNALSVFDIADEELARENTVQVPGGIVGDASEIEKNYVGDELLKANTESYAQGNFDLLTQIGSYLLTNTNVPQSSVHALMRLSSYHTEGSYIRESLEIIGNALCCPDYFEGHEILQEDLIAIDAEIAKNASELKTDRIPVNGKAHEEHLLYDFEILQQYEEQMQLYEKQMQLYDLRLLRQEVQKQLGKLFEKYPHLAEYVPDTV